MINKITAILFDKDGTLIDFDATWRPAYIEAAKRLEDRTQRPGVSTTLLEVGGLNITNGLWAANSLLASGSNSEIIELWDEHLPDLQFADISTIVLEVFHKFTRQEPQLIPGVRDTLFTLREYGLKLGIATMDDEITAKESMTSLHLASYFDFICGADSGFGLKPNAGMVHGFCNHCAIHPNNVLMIGDSPHDLNMGRNAGAALCIGVLSGAHNHSDIVDLADDVIEDVSQLPRILNLQS